MNKKEILDLEKQYEFLESDNSPSKIVGFKPSKNFKKVKHRIPMLSLSNAFDKDDLVNFLKKIKNYLSLDENEVIDFSAEPKIDGISASLTYKNGKFILGLSRGDGKEGVCLLSRRFNIPGKTLFELSKTVLSFDKGMG